MTNLLMRRPNLDGLPPLPAPPPGFVLRPATEADAPALAAVLRRAFADETWTALRVQAELPGRRDREADPGNGA